MFNWISSRFALAVAGVLMASLASVYLAACPFCSPLNRTFSEQIKANDIVVVASLLKIPEPVSDPDQEIPRSLFEISSVIKGEHSVRDGMKFRSLLVGKYEVGEKFLVMGVDPPNVTWSTPMNASPRVVEYLETIQTLPESGTERLQFFQKYFEDDEPILAFDAYDEFALAPYEDVVKLKNSMDREQIVNWIRDPDTATNRRRLYFTMLGICGQAEDIELLEEYIQSGDRKKQAGLDALVACYLRLKGEAGLPLIEKTFLRNEEVDYADTLSAVYALRFHGTEEDMISKAAIIKSIRSLLDRPKIADLIIGDLARWEDWSVVDKLAQMFKDADEETSWLRVPIASYLRACPLPTAKKHIEELRKIDPDAITRADFFIDFDDVDDEEEEDTDEAAEKPVAKDEKPTDATEDQAKPVEAEEGSAPKSAASDATSLNNSGAAYIAHRVPYPATAANHSVTESVGNQQPQNQAENLPAEPLANNANNLPQLAPATVATIIPVPIWQIILIPMGFSVGIFVLLWSVISGWFDRLIY